MPTVVHFVGGEESVSLQEGYDQVSAAFLRTEAFQQFTRVAGDNRSCVTVFKSSITYIEEVAGASGEPQVAAS